MDKKMKGPIGPIEALKLALYEEKRAIKLYKDLSEDYPAARDVLLFLVDEERKHEKLIEKTIYKLTK